MRARSAVRDLQHSRSVLVADKALGEISQLMRALGRAVRDLQHERSGRVADKARGEAECFISHENTPRVL